MCQKHAPKQGFEVSQICSVTKIYPSLTLVSTVTKNVEMSYNLACTADTAEILGPVRGFGRWPF